MSGVSGWFGHLARDAQPLVAGMMERAGSPIGGARAVVTARGFALGAAGPAATADARADGSLAVAWQGHPFWIGDGPRLPQAAEFSRAFLRAYRERGPAVLEQVGGDFSLAAVDSDRQRVLLAVDRIGVRTLIYRADRDGIVFGPTCDAVATPGTEKRIDPQAIYDYMYFHMVPGPDTVFAGFKRVLPGHRVLFENWRADSQPYWRMRFVEDAPGDMPTLSRRFRDALRRGVATFADGAATGAFLSGGTDSSTVSGLLGEISARPVNTYSIGFDASGYDEMHYARVAARHFRTGHHEYYVTPSDVVTAVPLVAAAYDQPFGNASAVPVYYCAKQAKADGIARMLAGDGGDELFGGNARYAKQAQLALYERVPRAIRERVIEPALLAGSWTAKLPLARKLRSYVQQARLPMPARYETYNLLERLGPENVFDRDFLSSVDVTRPLRLLKEAYDGVEATSLINRMLGIDLKFTLADNDLQKVTRMCGAAGVDVAFPMLHESVVEFSAALAPALKLRGTRLRYFFKEALGDFLPQEIIRKRKHGFGLPSGLWIRDHAPLNALARDALASVRKRAIFRGDFLDALLSNQLQAHPAYYGTMAWILMMLELWYEAHSDPVTGRREAQACPG